MKWTLPEKPIIMSEFGSEAKIGNHGPETQRWTEEQQASVYKHELVMFPKNPSAPRNDTLGLIRLPFHDTKYPDPSGRL